MISLVRVDDRLIHGQVATQWVQHAQANRIYIIDDLISKDDFLKKMMISLAPPGTIVRVVSVASAIENMDKVVDNDKVRAMILVKTPHPILELVRAGIKIDTVILGGMGANPNRKRLSKAVAVDENELNDIKELIDRGVKMINQIVPYTPAEDTLELLRRVDNE